MTYKELESKLIAAQLDSRRLREALEMLFDKWENGMPCYEAPDDLEGPLGNAFNLSKEEEDRILALIPSILNGNTLPTNTTKADALLARVAELEETNATLVEASRGYLKSLTKAKHEIDATRAEVAELRKEKQNGKY